MTEIVAFCMGALAGWFLGRYSAGGSTAEATDTDPAPRGRRPSRRQRKILAMFPEPSEPESLDALITEEIAASGATGATDLAPDVALEVWKRDRPGLDCDNHLLVYEVDPGVHAAAATPDQVRLICRTS